MPLLAYQLMTTCACFELEKKRQDKIFCPSRTQRLTVSLGVIAVSGGAVGQEKTFLPHPTPKQMGLVQTP